jgi:hypothetical protein
VVEEDGDEKSKGYHRVTPEEEKQENDRWVVQSEVSKFL